MLELPELRREARAAANKKLRPPPARKLIPGKPVGELLLGPALALVLTRESS